MAIQDKGMYFGLKTGKYIRLFKRKLNCVYEHINCVFYRDKNKRTKYVEIPVSHGDHLIRQGKAELIDGHTGDTAQA